MPLQTSGAVGPQRSGTTAQGPPFYQGKFGEQIVSEVHGRYYEANLQGKIYCAGIGLTAINAATYTTGTLGATVTPVIGLYNPIGSKVNLNVLQAYLGVTITALQATGAAPFVWATTVTTANITAAGNRGFNCSTFQPSGTGLDYTNIAPTGMTPNLAVRRASSLGGGSATNAAFLATAVAMQTIQVPTFENLEGNFLIPPGGLLVLLATTTPVAHSVASGILWEEVDIIS